MNNYVEVVAVGEDGVRTEYRYGVSPEGGEVRTTVRAFGTDCAVTNTVVSYADGRTKETLLNGIVKTAYEYGPNWTKPYEGPAGLDSPRWSCSYEDALGRTIAEVRPGFRGALLVTSNAYDTASRLVSTRAYSQPSQPSSPSPSPITFTSFTYDSLGDLVMPSFDMNTMKTSNWPRTEEHAQGDGFLHSDTKNVAYFFNYVVFGKIVEVGGLR